TAQLINASEVNSTPLTLETARVRVESRLLSPARQPQAQDYEIELGRSLSRDDADHLISSVLELTKEDARAVADGDNKWRVIITKQSGEEAEALSGKLEEAGFPVVTSFE